MLYRLARATLMGVLLVGLTLTSTAGVAAQSGPDVSLKLTGPARVKSGAMVVYTITVTNVGSETATGLHIDGGVGDQFNPVSMQCQDNGSFGPAECTPGPLAAGASVTAKFTAFVCCLVKRENRSAPVTASVGSESFVDPTPEDNWVQRIVFIIGGRVK